MFDCRFFSALANELQSYKDRVADADDWLTKGNDALETVGVAKYKFEGFDARPLLLDKCFYVTRVVRVDVVRCRSDQKLKYETTQEEAAQAKVAAEAELVAAQKSQEEVDDLAKRVDELGAASGADLSELTDKGRV